MECRSTSACRKPVEQDVGASYLDCTLNLDLRASHDAKVCVGHAMEDYTLFARAYNPVQLREEVPVQQLVHDETRLLVQRHHRCRMLFL